MTGNPIRILLADDHELVRQGMRAILEREPGWTVCGEAATGSQALAMTLDLRPDVLVLDLSLPEMNGVDVTRALRRTTSTPILIVTMHSGDHVVRRALDAGANGFVLKADAARTLIDALCSVLSSGSFVSEAVRARPAPASADRGTPKRRTSRALTSREREVLQLLAEGHANRQIGSALGITTKTAETHRARIMAKLELHSIGELVRYAIRNHIIEP
jgi:DNA-binding NarL/FixJ family response regulator